MIEPHAVTGLAGVPPGPSTVCVGFFDGVHLGHQAIVTTAVRHARTAGVRGVAVTFDRHPAEVVRPGSQPWLLMTLARRVRTLATVGCDLVVVLPFDDALRHWSPQEFVDTVLSGPLQATVVVVGANFRFGHRAAGDLEVLSRLGAERGFVAEGVQLLTDDTGEPISSTRIRAALDDGAVDRAARMLGRPHLVDGVVVRGDQRGASLGFPTANLQVDPRVAVPARGIYAGYTHLPGDLLVPSVTSVGVNPTFGGQALRVEAYLLDYSGDLYGSAVAVDFRHRLREERRYHRVDDLVTQMHADVAAARRLLRP